MLALLNIFSKKLKGYAQDKYFYFETPKGLILKLTTNKICSSGNIEVIGSYENLEKTTLILKIIFLKIKKE